MRQHMSIPDRAKQFMSFSALKGYEEAVAQSEVRKYDRIILGEDAQTELDFKLRNLKSGDRAEIVYYENGQYISAEGVFRKIDRYSRTMFIGEREIKTDDIYDIKKARV